MKKIIAAALSVMSIALLSMSSSASVQPTPTNLAPAHEAVQNTASPAEAVSEDAEKDKMCPRCGCECIVDGGSCCASNPYMCCM
ncbi:hypothetical protein [Chondromyces apiculatus]|uniref:Uncharacterized protein n=1 Tax=Chondromyces apiculatus DSM 436 TaxID=1192034 RepID=A0A017T1M6_9BACT|nr:hypothetical protein [Chondromyces apiculatus]EYF02897.1 Hypothetical protein CAP_6477 [Chondromyces apiculatus DSM 436]